MLARFPFNDLYEERALILSRTLHGHKQALSIYVYKLKNYIMAEQYCAKHYSEESEDGRDIYVSLLEVYLIPPEAQKPLLDQAFSILNKYYKQIDAPKALELLPTEVPVKNMLPFFKNAITEKTHARREKQILASLLKLDNLSMQEQLIHARAHMIKITENRECQYCHKRLGNYTAFARYPNGVVVHYKCMADPNVCPVTGTKFSKQPYAKQ